MSGYSDVMPSWDRPPDPIPISAAEKKKLDDDLDKYMGRGRQKRFRKSRRVSNRRRRNKSIRRRRNKSIRRRKN
jgi:hypothetical protein